MANYQHINDLITDLIRMNDGDASSPNIDNFSSLFYNNLTDALPSDFWEKLLTYLKTEAMQDIYTSPIQEETFNEVDNLVSVFNFINKNADLSNGVWTSLANAIKDDIDLSTSTGVSSGNKRYFWNESMNYIVAQYLKTMDPATAQILLGTHNGNDVYVPISDIKNADAAWSFLNKWVKPLKNIDEIEYENVRAEDAIQSVLKNSNQMQFTHSQTKMSATDTNKWIRLIMPKYLRKVEVEDLNRNFWVIAQVMSAVCAYLFGDNSLSDILRRMLNELIQLWENVLYLWASIAMISQKQKITDVHVEVVPLPNSISQPYVKFDNFGSTVPIDTESVQPTVNWATIYARVKHIIDGYPNSHVVIIPQIREGNYKHNYYYRESYPGAIVYDRNKNQINYMIFELAGGQSVDGKVNFPVIDLKYEAHDDSNYTYADKIGSIFEDEVYYQYQAPFSDAIADTAQDNRPYYAALRTIPNVSVIYDSAREAIDITMVHFSVFDVSQEVIKDDTAQVIDFLLTADWTTEDLSPNDSSSASFGYQILPDTTMTTEILTDVPITKGYYLGELISYQSLMALPTYTITDSPQFGQQMLFATPSDVKAMLEE